VNRRDLITRLNEHLTAEITANKIYTAVAERLEDLDLSLLLKTTAAEESEHARLLAGQIERLGGTPDSFQKTSEDKILKIMEDLKQGGDLLRLNYVLEKQAIIEYKNDLLDIEDPAVCGVIRRILDDEIQHRNAFEQAINAIRKSSSRSDSESPLDVFIDSIDAGTTRLNRTWLEMFMSGIIGALHVTFGALAMSAVTGGFTKLLGAKAAFVLGAAIFPIGFILLKLSRSELFTENFLVPVAPVFERKEPVGKLGKLWFWTLFGNLFGVIGFTLLVALGGIHSLGVLPAEHLKHLALYKVSRPYQAEFFSAFWAGVIITTMTWLVLATRDYMVKMIAIWSTIFILAVLSFTHVIVSTSEVFLGMLMGADISILTWFKKIFIPGVVGNLSGGLLFISLLHYLQIVHAKKEHERYEKKKEQLLSQAILDKLRL